jgi:hypothetical protein
MNEINVHPKYRPILIEISNLLTQIWLKFHDVLSSHRTEKLLKMKFKPLITAHLSHLFSEEKPSASNMCARISSHTYDRQNE